VTFLPFISLDAAVFFLSLAWNQRRSFSSRPYFFWFIYLHLAAVGLHQFEEYGWPGGFRDIFAGVFPFENSASLVPSSVALEALNVFGLMSAFGLIGWIGTRVIWIGLGLLFVNFSNAFFHLVPFGNTHYVCTGRRNSNASLSPAGTLCNEIRGRS